MSEEATNTARVAMDGARKVSSAPTTPSRVTETTLTKKTEPCEQHLFASSTSTDPSFVCYGAIQVEKEAAAVSAAATATSAILLDQIRRTEDWVEHSASCAETPETEPDNYYEEEEEGNNDVDSGVTDTIPTTPLTRTSSPVANTAAIPFALNLGRIDLNKDKNSTQNLQKFYAQLPQKRVAHEPRGVIFTPSKKISSFGFNTKPLHRRLNSEPLLSAKAFFHTKTQVTPPNPKLEDNIAKNIASPWSIENPPPAPRRVRNRQDKESLH